MRNETLDSIGVLQDELSSWFDYSPSTLRTDIRFLKDGCGVRLRMGRKTPFDDQHGIEVLDKMDLHQAVFTVGELAKEVTKYPPNLIRRSGLKVIRIVEGIKGDPVYSAPGWGGFYDSDTRTIYVIDICIDDTFHHEFAHCLDNLEDARDSLTLWKKTFPKKDYVGDGFIDERSIPRKSGFVRPYGRVNPSEDRATVLEWLMTSDALISDRLKTDKILGHKVELMKNFLLEISGGLMDKHFFEDFNEGKVNRGYWDKAPR